MLSEAHRFLAGRTPGGPDAHRIWVLHGAPVQDIFFHDTFHGCVSIWRSLALWAIHNWAIGDELAPPLVVLLTSTGELDFSYNADSAASQAERERAAEEAATRFEQMRRPRAQRYGHRRNQRNQREGGQQSAPSSEEERQRQRSAEAASGQVRNEIGGQGLINRMRQITQAFKHARPGRIFVMVESLPEQLGRLSDAEFNQARQIIEFDWTEGIDQTHAMVVLVHPEKERLREALGYGEGRVNWEWTEIPGPTASEITEAILRSARRRDFAFRQPMEVGEYLVARGFLRESVGVAARVVNEGDDVSLATIMQLPPVDEAEVARVLDELNAMVGLAKVKEKAAAVVASARGRRQRLEENGSFPHETMHMIFTGSAGTGKSTVARLFARLYRALGLLSGGQLVEATTSKGIFDPAVGRTGQNMQSLIESALGGVLFIDEAHSLGKRERDRGDGPAMEAVQALVPMAENHRHDLVIILAMYATGLGDVLAMNEGLPRRFPLHGRFEFSDYTTDELWVILQRQLAGGGWQLAADAENGLRALLRRRSALPGFGNVGGVRSLVSEVVQLHDAREGSRPGVLELEDLPPAVVQRPEHIREAEAKLAAMVGLRGARAMLATVVARLRYDAQEGKAGDLALPRMLFVGPPGTGKTTVAQLLAQLLYGHGLLENDRCETVSGPSLKGPFQGQSTERVRECVTRARGGVLLIDEAYGIVSGREDTFGQEAQAELMVQMAAPENQRTVFILAGYEPDVDEMMGRNPGMGRRFPAKILFDNFTPDDCAEVARRVLTENNVTWEEDFIVAFALRAREAIAAQGPTFGNAGWAKTEVRATIDRMKTRVQEADIPTGDPRRRMVLLEDLQPQQDQARRETVLRQAETELDDLVGLTSTREVLRKVAAIIKYRREEGQADRLSLPGMLFVGPPGTGKTTVAELMAKLLYGHGVLDHDRCVKVTGAGLKAPYLGQTTGLVRQKVSEARGGVLLIDEAYGIVSGPEDMYGQEAQQQLLKEVLAPENASTVFILAGYERDVDKMVERNPGMLRRFSEKVHFDNFTPDDCAEVARRILTADNMTWEEGFLEAFARLARHTIAKDGARFGNAGWARTTVGLAVTQMILRLEDEEGIPVGDPRRRQVTVADLGEAAGMPLGGDAEDFDESGEPQLVTTADAAELASEADWRANPSDQPMPTSDDELSDTSRAISRMHESSVHIVVENNDGRRGAASGFVVTHDGLVVTNAHVVEDARVFTVLVGSERTPVPGRVVRVGSDVDLALIAVEIADHTQMRPLPLGISAVLGQLDDVIVMGNASVNPGESARVVLARVSRNDPEQDLHHFEVDGGIEGGFSGGAVLHPQSSSAVGVVVGGRGDTVKVIIRSEQVRLMLAELGYTFQEA